MLDVPEWAELALDKIERGQLHGYFSAPPASDGGSEPQAERMNWGVGLGPL
jgi:hypothetical protein